MKKIVKSALIGTLSLVSMCVFAGTGDFNNLKTTCYVFNASNLVKKGSCTYSGVSGGNGWGGFFEASFTVKGYKKFSVVNSVFSDEGFDPNGSGELLGKVTEIITLNNVKAQVYYRDRNSLKILSANEAKRREEAWIEKGNAQGWENMGIPSYITCYKQIKSNLELCFIDK